MKKCIQTDKPLVSILLAVYKPNEKWLREQLLSLNNQTYKKIELIICDDCPDEPVSDKIFEDAITNFSWSILRNSENMGSNKTFEKLTLNANGEYIAYCDQDDRWCEDKISTLLDYFSDSNVALVCSDMYVINHNGEIIANSITEVRRGHVFKTGFELSTSLLFSNFVTGCAMIIKSNIAKKAVPFCPYMVHDHWIALYVSSKYKIISINKPLIEYRIHDNNQTLVMSGVYDKKSYVKVRLEQSLNKMNWLREYYSSNENISLTIDKSIFWIKARIEHFNGSFSAVATILKYSNFQKRVSWFEVFAPYLPNSLFMKLINLKKKNIL